MLSLQIPGFIVRPIRLEDAEAWASYVCLPEVMQHTSSTAKSAGEVKTAIELTLPEQATSPLRFVLIPEGTTAIVATVGFHTISAIFGTAEVTSDVAPSHWGRGIASTACRAATLWGFDARSWHRIQATTVVPNLASQRVLEKVGFKREGLLRNFRLIRGEPADYWVYSAIPGEIQNAF